MAPSETNQNPVQGEFFSADLSERFIRESVQNSLDARAGRDPVTVRFTISGAEGAVGSRRARRYLKRLRSHFEAVMDAESAVAGRNSDRVREFDRRKTLLGHVLPFLVVEDFGTTGLQGDISANDIRARGNDFWGFFRSSGITPKNEDAGGSWGLGKWVFPDASRLKMLKLHVLEGRKYPPVGFFAAGSNKDDKDWLPMPVESVRHASTAGRFGQRKEGCFVRSAMNDFGLRPDGDPGTSVVILHPMDELTDPMNLTRAVIRQYFHPIIARDLVVEIVAPREPERRIDAETIVDEARRIGDGAEDDPEQRTEALVRVIELARWVKDEPRG